jgi:hypothetical protein
MNLICFGMDRETIRNTIGIDWTQVLERKPPRYLYAYRADDRFLIDTLEHQRVYLSDPLSFNDPFDCQLCVNFKASPKDARKKTREILSGSARHKFMEPRKRLHAFSRALASAANGELHRAGELKDKIRTRMSQNGVFCLTEDSRSVLMWSHYACKHEGVCLQFDTKVEGLMREARQVQYLENYPELNYLRQDDGDIFTQQILSKASSWHYEKEWRIFRFRPPADRYQQFKPDALKTVIFGVRMTSRRKNDLALKLKKIFPQTQIMEARVSDSRFEIRIHPFR